MDRLICGDVGFGKTEVAMRAAFVAAMSRHAGRGDRADDAAGAPALQDASPIGSGAFPSRCASCRASCRHKDADETRRRHRRRHGRYRDRHPRAVGQAVRFKNLGLLIIDEEQHFGVTHKERLKADAHRCACADADRDADPAHACNVADRCAGLSIIGTPPVDRLAIRTYVSEFDTVTVREALLREHYRGGQSFYVVPAHQRSARDRGIPARPGARGDV